MQEYWTGAIDGYRPATTVFFDGTCRPACGNATSAVGPVLLPGRRAGVHRPRLLRRARSRASAPRAATFAEAYVIAHEYGHHVQHLLGTTQRVGARRSQGAEVGAGAARAAGRLLRRRVGRARRRHAPHRGLTNEDSERSTPRPRSATTASRRRARERRPALVHARHGAPAPEVVLDRLPAAHAGGLQHVRAEHGAVATPRF